MRKILTAALLGIVLLSLTPLHAATPQQTFKAVINKYSKVNTLKASFIEQVCSKTNGTCTRLEGNFAYAYPNKFRLDVETPSKQLLVSDGKMFWIYIPAQNQAIQTFSGPEQELFLFFTRLKDYDQTYNVNLEPTKDSLLNANFSVKQGKKAFMPAFTLVINPATNKVVELKIEKGDSEISFQMKNVEHNPKFAQDLFTFEPPEGTVIVKDTGKGYDN